MKPLPCPAPLWPRFSALLDTALELDEPARAAWLAALPEPDAELRPWLAGVLLKATNIPTQEWLERPPHVAETTDFANGQRLGPWRLLRPLGSGGMGAVWLALRADGAYEREVALKLPHAHLLSGALKERFARERNFLAGLAHPHIARFYDAGLAENGQPWLALEYVEGLPLNEYCETRALDLAARITLIQQVASAVQAAHARLIVHRDLKPANVLVTAGGQVKLLDFGIAKLLDDETPGTALTQAAGRAATLDYAAPEQLSGDTITVATDVYALGVMLYELLTGARPFAPRSRLGQMLDARGEAPLPSSKVRGQRHDELLGDLDAILAKALDADPAQRYISVEAFAADLGRHLAHQPINARRIGRWQRGAKFVRRNRRSLGFAVVLLLVLAGGISGVLWQTAQTTREARRAEAVKNFLVSVFKASDPRIASDKPRGSITARELLDRSSERIETEFSADPPVQIELLSTVAEIYRDLDEQARYTQLQARFLAQVRQHYGDLHKLALEGSLTAAQDACLTQDRPRCIQLQQEADALLIRAKMNHSTLRGRWWITEGQRLKSEQGAEKQRRIAFETAVQLLREHAPREDSYVTALDGLAGALPMGEGAKAVSLRRQAIEIAQSLRRRNDANLQVIYGNLGVTYIELGDYAEASKAFSRSAELAERTTGAHSHRAWVPRSKAAMTRHLMGEREAANLQFEQVMAVLPPLEQHNYKASYVRETYGGRLAAEGRPELGIPLLEAAEQDYLARPFSDFDLRKIRRTLGDAYDRAGRSADARRALKASVDDYAANEPAESPPLLTARERWGRFLLEQGDIAAAQAQFDAVLSQARGRKLSSIALAQGNLARIALARKNTAASLAFSADALKTWEQVSGSYDVRMGPYLQRIRADVLVASGNVAGAQKLEDEAAAASARYDHPQSATVQRRVMKGMP